MPVSASATRSSETQAPASTPAPATPTPSVTTSRSSSWMQSAPPAMSLGNTAGWTPSVSTSASSGAPLPSTTQTVLERSFQTNFDSVRVHTDSQGQNLTRGLSTRAVTYGNHIFLGAGERPSDLRVMAHEAAHVVQQRGAPTLQQFSTGGDAFESEAEQASAAVLRGEQFNVQGQTGGPRMQGLLGISLPNPINWLAGKANIIPGFRMFTIVLGVNPINMSPVDRSPGNILRALIEFLPGGGLITQALDSSGVFEKAGDFVAKQIATLGLVGSSIKASVTDFIKGLSLPGDLLSPGSTWERAKRIFTDPIDRIKNFAKGLVAGIVQLVKDAILKPIAKLAEGTEGYNLLKGVLGKDPITGETVTTTAETLLGPLMKMIGLGDVWAKMQQAKAIPRAWQWFQTTKSQLIGFVSQIPGLFIAAFKALTLEDIILIPKAFAKLANVFGGFIGKFVGWGLDAMWKLLEIVFDVVSPGAYGYVKKTGAALKSILKNPLPFVGNLVKAGKAGFTNFAGRFVTHLKAGLIDWLTGSLAGVYIPRSFTLGEVVKFVFSVLGLTWANVRQKLVKATSETVVVAMETGFDIVKTLVTQGPAAAWDKIQAQLSSLKDQVIQGIVDLVVDAVVTKAVPKLIAMFIPGAGFISAIISIYDTVMVFVNKISKIIQVVTAFINSIVAIAAGNIGAAASKVESILAGLLSLAINFLAGFAGLGKIANKIMGIVNKIRAPIDKALDALIAWIVGMAKKLGKFLIQAGVPQDPKERLRLGMRAAAAAAKRLGGRLTRSLLDPIFSGIKARYSLRLLEAFEQGGTWWVRAANSPVLTQNLNLPAGAAGTPAAPGVWPVAIGNNLKVPNSHRIETVQNLTATHITYSLSPRGEVASFTRPYADFMADWNAKLIQLTGQMSTAQLRAEYTRLYNAEVADAILRRDELANNFALLQTEQAHHILPVGVLKAQGIMHLLIKSGWNFNSAMNGIPLESAFHGSHPNYNNYVNRKVMAWVATNGSSNTVAFRLYVNRDLIPTLRNHIIKARSQFATTKQTLNDYFANLP